MTRRQFDALVRRYGISDALRGLDAIREDIERSNFVDTYCLTAQQIRKRRLASIDRLRTRMLDASP